METTPVSFDFQEKSVRTLTQPDGSTWFVARDVCEALDITWSGSKVLASLPDNWRGVVKLTTPLRNQHGAYGEQDQEFVIINEPALYKLAFRSNKPAAEDFTNWVASEVLPAIRQVGSYTAPGVSAVGPGEARPPKSPFPALTPEDRILLARDLVAELNRISDQLPTLSILHNNLSVLTSNVMRSMCALDPDIHNENLRRVLRGRESMA